MKLHPGYEHLFLISLQYLALSIREENVGFTTIYYDYLLCKARLVIRFKRENGVVTGNWPVSSGTLSTFDVIGTAVDIIANGKKAHCP